MVQFYIIGAHPSTPTFIHTPRNFRAQIAKPFYHDKLHWENLTAKSPSTGQLTVISLSLNASVFIPLQMERISRSLLCTISWQKQIKTGTNESNNSAFERFMCWWFTGILHRKKYIFVIYQCQAHVFIYIFLFFDNVPLEISNFITNTSRSVFSKQQVDWKSQVTKTKNYQQNILYVPTWGWVYVHRIFFLGEISLRFKSKGEKIAQTDI